MPDNDIMAYMVLGHPLGDNKGQAITVLEAASHLLSTGDSVVLQERMKQSLGIDVLDVESGSGDLSRSMLTIGKYLTPKLFVSYGQSLFGVGGLFRMRYSLSNHWEVQTNSGIETGGDLFYKIDFK
jgi:translocation and assembly module TamB